jgi:hypothetical protein
MPIRSYEGTNGKEGQLEHTDLLPRECVIFKKFHNVLLNLLNSLTLILTLSLDPLYAFAM